MSVPEPSTPRVRWLGSTPVADGEWQRVVDDIKSWYRQGAPSRAIAEMVRADYAISLDDETIRVLLTGTDSVEPPRD